MATRLTQFQLARLGRRTSSDIKNLARSYQTQFAEVNSQYAKDFADYQKNVADQMAPYEAAVARYSTEIEPQYRADIARYNAELAAYQRELADIEANPFRTEMVEREVRVGKDGMGRTKKMVEEQVLRDIPVFQGKPPKELPEMPTAPEVAAFDTSKYIQKQKSLGQGLERETAERKAARRNVMQRGGRTMLSGA
jgi:hypothetical protein